MQTGGLGSVIGGAGVDPSETFPAPLAYDSLDPLQTMIVCPTIVRRRTQSGLSESA